MTQLIEKSCTSNPRKLENTESETLLSDLNSWSLNENKSCIKREFNFKNYYQTVSFINAVIWIIHNQDHHPDIHFSYNKCTIALNTHSVNGLSKNDFICAAKIDQLITS